MAAWKNILHHLAAVRAQGVRWGIRGSWRLQRRLRLGRWATLLVAKRGVSLSLGRRGVRLNIGRNGLMLTFGIPGTGVSYRWVWSARWLTTWWRRQKGMNR